MIDFRSDTVTKPCAQMRQEMFIAEVGDDVYGDDPTVNALEIFAAKTHGFEKALFVSSGTQANLLALMTHCQRGDEYLCGQNAHNYKFEAGGAAVLGSIQPQPITNEDDGSIDLEKAVKFIKPNDFHFARTKLLSLENTISGKTLPLTYLSKARYFVDQYNLKLHLDGARVYNAATELNVNITEICKYFDSVSICLSKGLGAPIGSLLLGNTKFIEEARKWRKMLGGGLRQSGILAAAGLYALKNNIQKLAIDHFNAQYLACELKHCSTVESVSVYTNMVFITFSPHINLERLINYLETRGILLTNNNPCRLVLHLNITQDDINYFIIQLQKFNDL